MPATSRERLSLDRGWRFHLGDIAFPVVLGHSASYNNAKAARASGAASPDYDDSVWRELDLPHDWAVESPFDPSENVSQGYRRRGIAWYRRHFALPLEDRGRHLELQFDGVASHCTVWVNGTIAHRNWCGYTSFSIDLTPLAQFDDELNHIAIRVDAHAQEGWWYEGAGLYRHTWLVKRDRTHLVTDGVHADPVRAADGAWSVPVAATVANCGETVGRVTVRATLLDAEGSELVAAHAEASVAPLAEITASLALALPAPPRLWSVRTPVLYHVRTVVLRDGAEVDAVVTPCGFRTLRFDPDAGFFLNDQPLKLQGVCCHQDHAGVGVALPDALWEFRVRRLKEMGVNAYRCSHHPPSVEFLDLCDRHGILVMDETRHFNSTPEYLRQLEWLVRRDRNHPCVFLWSVFNEEPMQGTAVGYEMVRRMVALVKRLDSTRPVTAAMNGGLFNPVNVSQAVDVVGFNYQIEFYDRFHAANPGMCLTSSEDTSAYMTRGEFATERARNVIGAYDTERAPWGATHRAGWRAVAERPYLAGGFVWTGFDYRGEPTPHQWPSAGSFFGCMDLCGFPKTAFHIHQAHWRDDRPVLELAPHWTWPGREGQKISVLACTNADTVALFLDGRPLGEKTVDRFDFASWEINYAPGRLSAIAYKAGREVARAWVETAGAPVALELIADRPMLAGDGLDAQPITVRALDAQGRAVPTAHLAIEFALAGPGEIIGLGNGDPNCHEPEKGNRRSLFNGLAQVILQTTPNACGALVLRATAAGLRAAELTLVVRAVPARPAVAPATPLLTLQRWRMSACSRTRPDPIQHVAENDMNTWAGVLPGDLQSFADGPWAIYRIPFIPFADIQLIGGMLVFKSITGAAEIWLDGDLIAKKPDFDAAPFHCALPPAEGERVLNVLIHAPAHRPAGLGGPVTLEAISPALSAPRAADECKLESASPPPFASLAPSSSAACPISA